MIDRPRGTTDDAEGAPIEIGCRAVPTVPIRLRSAPARRLRLAQVGEVQAEVTEDTYRDALAFVEQGEQQVGGPDPSVAASLHIVDGRAAGGS